jgi:spore coat protein U-like protein
VIQLTVGVRDLRIALYTVACLGAALLMAGLLRDARAVQQATTTFQTQTVIAAECTLDTSGTLLDFGTRSFLVGDTDAQTAFTLQCTNETGYSIGINAGLNGSGQTHFLRGATTNHLISYYLYQDSTRVTYWSGQLADLKFGSGNGAVETHYIYGRILIFMVASCLGHPRRPRLRTIIPTPTRLRSPTRREIFNQ